MRPKFHREGSKPSEGGARFELQTIGPSFARWWGLAWFACALMACATPAVGGRAEASAAACVITQAIEGTPPEGEAVQNSPTPGFYYVNDNRTMWATASWVGKEAPSPIAAGERHKIPWFRPAGATLEISGRRIDAPAPLVESSVPCCYPTRFQ